VLIFIVLSVCAWIWNRPWNEPFKPITLRDRAQADLVRAGLRPAGFFRENTRDLEGIEVISPRCLTPTAILPVAMEQLGIASELTYRDDFNMAYAFDGKLYPEKLISYRLQIAAIARGLTSLVSGAGRGRLRYYLKIWTARGCQGLTPEEVSRLREAD
jgi:hypothetical protein